VIYYYRNMKYLNLFKTVLQEYYFEEYDSLFYFHEIYFRIMKVTDKQK